jgi:hypothetical protein
MTKHPVARDVTRTAAESGTANPQMVAAMTMLVGIGGAIYGQTINRATQRDADDPELYHTATTMLANWITSQEAHSATT